jgi:hypothetical protein
MEKQVVETSDAPRVIIDVKGSLVVKGSIESEVSTRSDPNNNVLEKTDDEVRVNCPSNCILRAPQGAELEIIHAGSTVTIKGFEGQITVRDVTGDLTMKEVGSVNVGTVRGNLLIKRAEGDLIIDKVGGNLLAKDIEGEFQVSDHVGGNLTLYDVEGDASAKANGNITLRLDPVLGQKFNFHSSGNIVCRLSQDASLKVNIEKAASVKFKLQDEDVPTNPKTPFQITLGEGDADLTLSAGGNVVLATEFSEWDVMSDFGRAKAHEFENMAEEISQQVAQQIESQMEFMESQMEAQLENLSASFGGVGLSPEAAERISRRAKEASARATARTQEKMKRAQEKIQRKIEAAQRRSERKARSHQKHASHQDRRAWSFDWSGGRTHQEPPASPVSDQERLLILKMLEENKISVEEAENLLAALEG